MAAYSYGGLIVRVTADTKPMAAEVASSATKSGNEAGRSMSRALSGKLASSARSVGRGIATGLGTATIAATAFGVESFKAAAKVDTMQSALRALATANHASFPQMQATVDALRRQGIEAGAAQSLVAGFTKGHLNLAAATKLATVAQNASTVTGKSSAETLLMLNKGIQTQNVRMLRTAGVAVDVKKALADYAAQQGINVKQLTAQQKSQAVLNAVMTNGGKVAGAYAAAMKTPGGVLKQLPVIIDEVKVSVGEGLVKALGPSIVGFGHLATSVSEAIQPGGKLAPIFDAIGRAATHMLAPLSGVIDLTAKWIDNLKPGQVDAMGQAISRFAPQLTAVGVGLSAFAGKNLLGDLPVIGKLLGGLGGPIGIVVSSLATLAITSPQARSALAAIATMLGQALRPIIQQIMPLVGQLGQAIGVLLAAALRAVIPLIPPIVVALQATLQIITPLLPVITVLANVLAKMAPVLVPLAAGWWAVNAAMDAYVAVTTFAAAKTALLAEAAIGTRIQLGLLKVQEIATAVATRVVTAAQWLLNVALEANPIGIVITALAALGVAFYLAWTKSATFRNIVIGAWHAVQSALAVLLNAWNTAFHAITGATGAAASFIQNNIGTMMRVVAAIMTGGMSEVVRLVVTNWGTITRTVANAASAVRNAVGNAFSAIARGAALYWGQVTSTVSGAWSAIVRNVQGAAGAVVRAAVSGFTSVLRSVGGLMGQIAQRVYDGWANIVSSAWRVGGDLINGLKNGILGAVSGIGSWIRSVVVDPIIGAVKGFFGIGSPSTVFLGIGLNLVKSLIGGMMPTNVGGLVNKVFGGFPQALAALIKRGFVAITQLPKKALNAVKGLLGGTLGAIHGVFSKLLGGIGFAAGGVLREPVTGVGHATGQVYHFAERGPELISPLSGRPPDLGGIGRAVAGAVINVYPSAGMNERQLAAMVSRELAWATAGGAG